MEMTKQVTETATLPLNVITFNQLQKVAGEKGHTVEALVEEVIQQYLQREAEQKMASEMETFRRLHPKLWVKYPRDYVAIYQGKLVDHDSDRLKLWLRLEQNYPHKVVLLRQVMPNVERVYQVRSPRLIRHEQNL
ncbi:hypothetical protein QUF64_14605 [Anaerolineales bacterium HSG6]|nr:hypothetical protein [Anaerolineales bacterium HSG6]MDM8531213.1 hypothetical protein [Anaerolineales bacterium HSG25]